MLDKAAADVIAKQNLVKFQNFLKTKFPVSYSTNIHNVHFFYDITTFLITYCTCVLYALFRFVT